MSWLTGVTKTTVGEVPVVNTTLRFSERLRSFMARCAIGRKNYRVEPGLYAVGNPTDKSPVFVSANYRMSFDLLRSRLVGIDSWILILDTRGINVWCAAGKGTFGTEELVRRIENAQLRKMVSHRKLILPQLGAPGVCAHAVKKLSDFQVIYGPVRVQDLPAFLKAGMKTTPEMRRVNFAFLDRIALIPAELVLSAKYLILTVVLFLLLSGLGKGVYSFSRVTTYGFTSVLILLLVYLLGNALPPAFLPWLPGRMFSVKGAFVGSILALGYAWYAFYHPKFFRGALDFVAWLLIIPAVISLMAMNFTGSSTYTSLSGVRREIKRALPFQVSAAIIGMGLWIGALFL